MVFSFKKWFFELFVNYEPSKFKKTRTKYANTMQLGNTLYHQSTPPKVRGTHGTPKALECPGRPQRPRCRGPLALLHRRWRWLCPRACPRVLPLLWGAGGGGGGCASLAGAFRALMAVSPFPRNFPSGWLPWPSRRSTSLLAPCRLPPPQGVNLTHLCHHHPPSPSPPAPLGLLPVDTAPTPSSPAPPSPSPPRLYPPSPSCPPSLYPCLQRVWLPSWGGGGLHLQLHLLHPLARAGGGATLVRVAAAIAVAAVAAVTTAPAAAALLEAPAVDYTLVVRLKLDSREGVRLRAIAGYSGPRYQILLCRHEARPLSRFLQRHPQVTRASCSRARVPNGLILDGANMGANGNLNLATDPGTISGAAYGGGPLKFKIHFLRHCMSFEQRDAGGGCEVAWCWSF